MERKHGFLPPPIPLDCAVTKDLNKDDYLTMKLQLIPNKTTSPIYKLNVPYFKDSTPEEWLKFLSNLQKVIVGQNLETGPTQFAMTHWLLVGDILSQFNKRATKLKEEAQAAAAEGTTINDIDIEIQTNLQVCLRAVTKMVLGLKALQT